jgi:GNAT superfamily N-acetyltransferase
MPADVLAAGAEDGRAWVAVDEADVVVGFAIAKVVGGEGHLDELAVLPAFGRRGVGRALVDAVVRWTTAVGMDAVTLSTFRDVPFNAPFYERLGFHALDVLTPELQGVVDEETAFGLDPSLRVVMRRTIDDAG